NGAFDGIEHKPFSAKVTPAVHFFLRAASGKFDGTGVCTSPFSCMATINYKQFTLGIEEEYMVLDPVTRELRSHEQKIVTEGQKTIREKVKAEMHQAVVEVGTDICSNVEEAFKDVGNLRSTIAGIAGDIGLWVGASGTHPFSLWQSQLI